MPDKILTQARLKELLSYDPDTGLFKWKKLRRGKSDGSIAGGINDLGYRFINLDREYHRAHRLAWLYVYGEWPKTSLDHINHSRADNRICNLREAPHLVNCKNRTLRINNTSGFTGVTFIKRSRKWRAQIKVNNQFINLGLFINKDDAIEARKAANIKYDFHENHGLFIPTTNTGGE